MPLRPMLALGLASTLGLAACQGAGPVAEPLRQSGQAGQLNPAGVAIQQIKPPAAAAVSLPPPVSYIPKVVPFARIEPVGEGQNSRSLRVNFTYPQAGQAGQDRGFRTQAFGCGEVTYAQIAVSGPALALPIYAAGSDAQNMVAATNCSISASLANVPFGNLVIAIRLYDANRQLLTGSELKGALRLAAGSQNIELSYRQMAAGKLLETLLNGTEAAKALAGSLDLTALQTFLDPLMGLGGSFPAYTFTHHPALVNVNQLRDDLLTSSGQFNTLTPDSRYLYTSGSLRFDLGGYLLSQNVQISLDDALSPDAVATANGQVILTNVPPGTWQLRLSGPGYLNGRVPVTVAPGQQTNQGTVNIYPPAPTLTGISPATGPITATVTLTGTQFNSLAANNIVRFGTVQGTVTAATATSLTVTPPSGLATGSHPVSVTIGAAAPATGFDFTVLGATVTNLSLSNASAGDDLVISGANFDPILNNNQVSFGGVNVTPTAGTSTSLTVAIPEVPAGIVPVTVTIGGQVSGSTNLTILPKLTALSTGQTLGGKTALIRGQTLTLSGNNFDPIPANNTIRLGVLNLTPLTASGTSLTVIVPSTLITPGDLNVSVLTNSQTSSTIVAVVPSINVNFNGGFN